MRWQVPQSCLSCWLRVWPTRNPCLRHLLLAPGIPGSSEAAARQRCSAIAPTARPTPICTRAGSWPLLAESITHRTDVGAELFWIPATTASGDYTRTMYIMGTFQFRPWQSSGFFMRVGSGMAVEYKKLAWGGQCRSGCLYVQGFRAWTRRWMGMAPHPAVRCPSLRHAARRRPWRLDRQKRQSRERHGQLLVGRCGLRDPLSCLRRLSMLAMSILSHFHGSNVGATSCRITTTASK